MTADKIINCQRKMKSCKCICKHILIMCDIFHLLLFRLACVCFSLHSFQLHKSHPMQWITPTIWNPELSKCPNRIFLAAKSKTSSLFQGRNTHCLHYPNLFLQARRKFPLFSPVEATNVIIVHIITVCLWVPLRPPSEHALASTEASPAEPNKLITHTKYWSQSGCCTDSYEAVQVYIVCQIYLHIKVHCCLSVSSYSYGVLGVHQNTITAVSSL